MNALSSIFSAWGGREEFLKSQAFMIAILSIAWFGDNWEPSYPRNDNHNMQMYYYVHVILFALAAITWTHKPRGSTATSKGPSNEEYEKNYSTLQISDRRMERMDAICVHYVPLLPCMVGLQLD